MTVGQRRARERQEVRERILGAARTLFVRDGYDKVTMRAIAAAVEYSLPVLYTHFADKEQMLRALCREDLRAFSAAFDRLRRVEDPVERLVKSGTVYVRFALRHPHQYRLMFMTPVPAGWVPTPDELEDLRNPEIDAYAFLIRTVQEAVASGRFRREHADVELLAQVFWAAVHGVASLAITHGADPYVRIRPAAKLAELAARSMVRGMLSDPADARDLGRRRADDDGGREP